MKYVFVDKFIEDFCEHFDTPSSVLLSQNRSRDLVDKRAVLAFFLRNMAKMTWSEIAKLMNRTHASIIHYAKTIENLVDIYPHIKEMLTVTYKLYDPYKDKITTTGSDMYLALLADNERLKRKVERNHNLIIELLNLEKNGTENKKQEDKHSRTEV